MDILLVLNVVSKLIFLLSAIEDFISKRILTCILYGYLSIGIINQLYQKKYVELLIILSIGVVIFMVIHYSRGRIGYGDGIILLGLFLNEGLINGIKLLFITSILLEIYAGILIILTLLKCEKVNLGKKIAFVPFLLCGMVVLSFVTKIL